MSDTWLCYHNSVKAMTVLVPSTMFESMARIKFENTKGHLNHGKWTVTFSHPVHRLSGRCGLRHFHMQTRGARNWIATLPVSERTALPPEPQLPRLQLLGQIRKLLLENLLLITQDNILWNQFGHQWKKSGLNGLFYLTSVTFLQDYMHKEKTKSKVTKSSFSHPYSTSLSCSRCYLDVWSTFSQPSCSFSPHSLVWNFTVCGAEIDINTSCPKSQGWETNPKKKKKDTGRGMGGNRRRFSV